MIIYNPLQGDDHILRGQPLSMCAKPTATGLQILNWHDPSYW